MSWIIYVWKVKVTGVGKEGGNSAWHLVITRGSFDENECHCWEDLLNHWHRKGRRFQLDSVGYVKTKQNKN